jgi:tetratricopeptide (TPR) repeat protein
MKKQERKKPVKKIAQSVAAEAPQQPGFLSEKRLVTVLGLLCAAFAFILYANSFGHGFVGDDDTVIAKNKITTQGIKAFPEIVVSPYRKGFWDRKESLYRPMSILLFATEWQLSPENPFLFHLVNVLLFAFTVFVMMKTLALMIPNIRGILIAFIATLLYAAHPIHTEVVDNVKSGDEIMCLLFSLLSLYFLFRYLKESKFLLMVYSLVSFLLALLSKENAITMLAVFPLTIYFFSGSPVKKIITCTLLFAGVTAAYFVMRINALGGVSNFTEILLINNSLVETSDKTIRFATAVFVLGKYLLLNFIPHPLTWDYSFRVIPLQKISDAGFLVSFLAYAALLVYAVAGFRKKNPIAFGIWFYLISIALVSNIFILIESTLAERFLFTPSLGICFALSCVLVQLISKNIPHTYKSVQEFISRNKKVLVPVFLIAVLFSVKTFARNTDWKDNYTLLSHDVKSSSESARIRYAYGSALLFEKALPEKNEEIKQAYLQKSIAELEKGISILNTYADAMYHLVMAYRETGDYQKAVLNWERAYAMKKNTKEEFFTAAAISYGSLQQYDKAIAVLKEASEKYPTKNIYGNLGLYLMDANQADSAIFYLEKSIQLDSSYYNGWFNLGNAWAKKQDYPKAIQAFNKAVELNPLNEDGWNNLANSYAAMKDFRNALKYFLKVEELNPSSPKAINNLAVTYYFLGDSAKANEYMIKAGRKK